MANRQPLKNALHHVIGYLDTDQGGRQTLLSPNYHKLGYYDPHTNLTKDEFHHTVGYGNLLTTLLKVSVR